MKKEDWSKLTVSLIYIVLGLVLIVKPALVGSSICYMLAAAVGVIGIVSVLSYFMTTVETRVVENSNGFAFGIVLIVLAIFIVAKKALIISLIPFIFGFMIAVKGILGIQNAINLRRFGYGSFKGELVAAVIILIFGIVLMIYPFEAATTLFIMMGVGLVFSGIIDITANFMISRQMAKAQKGK